MIVEIAIDYYRRYPGLVSIRLWWCPILFDIRFAIGEDGELVGDRNEVVASLGAVGKLRFLFGLWAVWNSWRLVLSSLIVVVKLPATDHVREVKLALTPLYRLEPRTIRDRTKHETCLAWLTAHGELIRNNVTTYILDDVMTLSSHILITPPFIIFHNLFSWHV